MKSDHQFLIFDADDTLWENNIYFEEAFAQFCSYLAHSSMTATEIREVLDEIEMVNTQLHGYGSRNFARNLGQCYRRLSERHVLEQDIKVVMEFAHTILDQPMQLLEDVEETIAGLSDRHTLTIFTKGDPEEQRLKIDRSGLASYFAHAAIVKEKHESAYRLLAKERGFDSAATWMIGNSPKSDILPALAAGLNAVFVPHARTWSLEQAILPTDHPRLRRVEKIHELQRFL